MKRKILLALLLVGFSTILYCQTSTPDSLALLFDNQLAVFPQEKIHVHTDKPYYISGERIWFRAHLADAASHTPSVKRHLLALLREIAALSCNAAF